MKYRYIILILIGVILGLGLAVGVGLNEQTETEIRQEGINYCAANIISQIQEKGYARVQLPEGYVYLTEYKGEI